MVQEALAGEGHSPVNSPVAGASTRAEGTLGGQLTGQRDGAPPTAASAITGQDGSSLHRMVERKDSMGSALTYSDFSEGEEEEERPPISASGQVCSAAMRSMLFTLHE